MSGGSRTGIHPTPGTLAPIRRGRRVGVSAFGAGRRRAGSPWWGSIARSGAMPDRSGRSSGRSSRRSDCRTSIPIRSERRSPVGGADLQWSRGVRGVVADPRSRSRRDDVLELWAGPVPSAMRDPAGVRQAAGGARCACGRLRRLSLGAGFQGPCIAFGLKSITSPPVRRVSRWSVKRLSLGSCASRRAVTDQSPRRNDVRSRQAERTAERNPRTVRLRFSACLVSSFDVPYT